MGTQLREWEVVLNGKKTIARNYYLTTMRKCIQGNHDDCPGSRPAVNDDPYPTVCLCCQNGHGRGEAQVRHESWRINRNWLRKGDPCRVKGIRGECHFRALLTNGETKVEVWDSRMNVRVVEPERVRRVAVNGRSR